MKEGDAAGRYNIHRCGGLFITGRESRLNTLFVVVVAVIVVLAVVAAFVVALLLCLVLLLFLMVLFCYILRCFCRFCCHCYRVVSVYYAMMKLVICYGHA